MPSASPRSRVAAAIRYRGYLRQGGWQPYESPQRSGRLTAHTEWLAGQFRQHRGNCDVVRQELLREHGIQVSLRTVERAVTHLRREVLVQSVATVRYETPPGHAGLFQAHLCCHVPAHVYIDTSAYTVKRYPAALVEFMRGHGHHKVLFGTDYPMIMPAKAHDGIDALGLDDGAKGLFLGGNAQRVFMLPAT